MWVIFAYVKLVKDPNLGDLRDLKEVENVNFTTMISKGNKISINNFEISCIYYNYKDR